MTAIKQNLLATTLLLTALSMSLLIGYWLNQYQAQPVSHNTSHSSVEIQKLNKLNHSFMLLLPAIR